MKKLFLFALLAFAIGCSKDGMYVLEQEPYLRINRTDLIFLEDQMTNTIYIETNEYWQISGVPFWCECTSSTGFGNSHITITVKPECIDKEEHNANLTITAGTLLESVSMTLKKKGTFLPIDTEIHVETKGELENVLADYDYANIESLKITGVLNEVDFLFIRSKMPELKKLDISEVNITALPTKAFYDSNNVEYLILPNTLTTIGKEMFHSSNLKSVVIPASVETIEYGAFEGCCALTSIEIPANVETIGAAAFNNCFSLVSVTFENGSHSKTIEGSYEDFYDQIDKKWYCFPKGAFSNCVALTSIEIPASVETIGKTAFMMCSSLATVTFEKGSRLKTIGGEYRENIKYQFHLGAFFGCSLTSIEIPASVETIGSCAFDHSGLETVDMSVCTQVKTIGRFAFGSIELFKIGTEIPPTCEFAAFSPKPYSVLQVPSGCVDAYKAASIWSNFASITGLDE